MPHLDASALTGDPEGLAFLAEALRPEGAPAARLVPSWRGPTPAPPPADTAVDLALIAAATGRGPVPRALARRVAARLVAGPRPGWSVP